MNDIQPYTQFEDAWSSAADDEPKSQPDDELPQVSSPVSAQAPEPKSQPTTPEHNQEVDMEEREESQESLQAHQELMLSPRVFSSDSEIKTSAYQRSNF